MNDLTLSSRPPVCFFDSGIGGLTILYESYKRLKDTNFIYFADNYNVPYGSLSREKMLLAVDKIFSRINDYNPSAAVIACNTVTAQCAAYLRGKYKFPIIGIQPAVKPAATLGGKCVVLSTPATASSLAVKELVSRYGNGRTSVVACPDLASYIERNIFDLDVNGLLSLLPKTGADSVVLGCTHYIYVKSKIAKFYGCPVFDGVDGTVNRLCNVLGKTDHFEDKIDISAGEESGNVAFVGGDEVKNKRVFEFLTESSGEIFPNKSQ